MDASLLFDPDMGCAKPFTVDEGDETAVDTGNGGRSALTASAGMFALQLPGVSVQWGGLMAGVGNPATRPRSQRAMHPGAVFPGAVGRRAATQAPPDSSAQAMSKPGASALFPAQFRQAAAMDANVLCVPACRIGYGQPLTLSRNRESDLPARSRRLPAHLSESMRQTLLRRAHSTGDITYTSHSVRLPMFAVSEGLTETVDDGHFRIGKYTLEERRLRILRYRQKRQERNFDRKIKYACRKTLADSRPRVRGRFAKNDDSAPSHAAGSADDDYNQADFSAVCEFDDALLGNCPGQAVGKAQRSGGVSGDGSSGTRNTR